MTYEALADNVARVREQVARVQAAEGLGHAVTIVAVTKGQPVTAVHAAWRAGLTDVGENRVQDALGKLGAVTAPVRWHLIGHLQTNKAKFVPGAFAMVHSVDSVRVAEALSRAAVQRAAEVPVLVQVNVAEEPQKSGCSAAEAGGKSLADVAAEIYAGPKAALRPIHDALMAGLKPFGEFEIAPKKGYVSLRRKKQFAMIGPGTNTPVEEGSCTFTVR